MNPDMHTTLLDVNILKPMETILKVLREQSEEDDQMNTAGETAGSIPETSLECEQVLKQRGGFREMSTMDICMKIWWCLRARTRVKARGMTSLPAEELTRGDR